MNREAKRRRSVSYAAGVALAPAWIIVMLAYVGTSLWTVAISFTSSNLIPKSDFVGFDQYVRLFNSARWLTSLHNLVVFGVLFIAICLALGFLLAVAIDREIRFEGAVRTVYLYPYSLSFIVTGVVWQWMLNPSLGIQKTLNDIGWTSFHLDWVVNQDMAIYALVLAAVWQSTGLVMALMLAGLRGIDADLWKAIKVDGVPLWKAYVSIILPIISPVVITATMLLGVGVVKAYDLVVVLTNGGPGFASDMPAKFIMDSLFARSNVGLASAGATVILIISSAAVLPWLYVVYFTKPKAR